MSHHEYELFGGEGNWKITVGWVERLESFRVEVLDIRYPYRDIDYDHDGSSVLVAGDSEREIETMEKLVSILQPYGEIPDDILSMLRDDKAGLTPL